LFPSYKSKFFVFKKEYDAVRTGDTTYELRDLILLKKNIEVTWFLCIKMTVIEGKTQNQAGG